MPGRLNSYSFCCCVIVQNLHKLYFFVSSLLKNLSFLGGGEFCTKCVCFRNMTVFYIVV
jgi:hypothetical protein